MNKKVIEESLKVAIMYYQKMLKVTNRADLRREYEYKIRTSQRELRRL